MIYYEHISLLTKSELQSVRGSGNTKSGKSATDGVEGSGGHGMSMEYALRKAVKVCSDI